MDECLRKPCGQNAVCSNTEGSYQCACKQGLTGDPFTACSDTDECSAQANICGSNAICKNTNPGFRCECPPGFSGNANSACEATEVCTLCKSNFDCTNNAVFQNGYCLHCTSLNCTVLHLPALYYTKLNCCLLSMLLLPPWIRGKLYQ